MARKKDNKKAQYEQRIKQEVNVTLRQNTSDPRLSLMTVTEVQLTNDFSIAKLFWDTFQADKKEEVEQALGGAKSFVRSVLAKNLNVRAVPEIVFAYDNQFESESKITDLLKDEVDQGRGF